VRLDRIGRPGVAVPTLLAFFVVAGWLSLRGDSATSDETPHVAAGISYLERGDFRMNPEHPPLAKGWAALAPWAMGRGRLDYAGPAWTSGDQWGFGFETLNGPLADPARRDPRRVLLPARAMILLLGAALGLVVWAWSRRLWGDPGALVSLFLFSLSPTMLAHARLVTTDLAAALGFTLAAWTFREALAAPKAWRIVAAGVAVAAALLSKFSAVLLAPILVLVAGAWVGLGEEGTRGTRGTRLRAAARALVGVGLVAWIGVWAGYGFRFAACAPGHELPWAMREAIPGGMSPIVLLARDVKILPEAWLFGLGAAMQDEIRLAYFHGEISELGFRWYFPAAFVFKTPPALLALSLWAVLGGAALWRKRRLDAIFLSGTFLIYAAVALTSRLNLGHRHLAPLEPLLFVACGAIPALAAARWKRWAAGALLAGYVVSWASATPGYLSYFNRFAGGARGGERWLLDSNLDWGQDLGRLAEWMRHEGIGEIALAYFGTADPQAYGIRYRKVFAYADFRREEPVVRPGPGELVAVSVNFLHGLYLNSDRDLALELLRRGVVPVEPLREYTKWRDDRIRAREPYPRLGPWLVDEGLATREQVASGEEVLLSTWLARLRERAEPVAHVGDSIRVYRVP
jgi:hypothetical protein